MIPLRAHFECWLWHPDGRQCIGKPPACIVDVSRVLPTKPGESYDKRDPSKIDTAYIHHSGAEGMGGYYGLLNSTKYVTTRKPRSKGSPGYPGAAYTYWIPRDCDEYDGALVVYRCNRDDVWSWHTGPGANETGIGIGLQGNLTRRQLSPHQEMLLPLLLAWLKERHKGLAISTHSRAPSPKPTCPGERCEAFLASHEWVPRVFPTPNKLQPLADDDVPREQPVEVVVEPAEFVVAATEPAPEKPKKSKRKWRKKKDG